MAFQQEVLSSNPDRRTTTHAHTHIAPCWPVWSHLFWVSVLTQTVAAGVLEEAQGVSVCEAAHLAGASEQWGHMTPVDQ